MTITRERVAQFIKNPLDNGLTRGEQMELARIALASLEAELVSIGNFSIPEPATLTNISHLCPLDVNLSQTDFSTGWNDCRQHALIHDGIPPIIKGVHAVAQGWNACRAAMQGKAESVTTACKLPANTPCKEAPDGCCIMPIKLTADNGAKGALSGEFHVTHRIICQSCGGEGCEDCNEDGGWDAKIPIGWDTIKRIHEAAVEACALPAAPQQEDK